MNEWPPDTHPSTLCYQQFFRYHHLPPSLQDVSKMFADVADVLVSNSPCKGPMLTKALDHLLQAKDCAVRAAL